MKIMGEAQDLYRDTERDRRNVATSGLVAGGVAFGANLLGKGHKAQAIRKGAFFGTAAAIGIYSDINSGDSVTQAVAANAIAGAAGMAAFNSARSLSPRGVQALSEFLVRHNQGRVVQRIADTVAKVRGTHPSLAAMLSHDSTGFTAAALALPVANVLYHRLAASGRRAAEERKAQAQAVDNQAGEQGERKDPIIQREPQIHQAEYKMQARISSHYDPNRALEDI